MDVAKLNSRLGQRPIDLAKPADLALASKGVIRTAQEGEETVLRLALPGQEAREIARIQPLDIGDAHAHTEQMAAFAKSVGQELARYSPREQRKLAALVKAARHNVSVKKAYASLRDGDFSAALASSDELSRGLALAAEQKIDLNANEW